jgi:glutamate-1-semialdehyde 2,1-aminomutase
MHRYKKSEEFLKRALKTVPLASQTFSKSITQFPLGVSPLFASKAKGSRIWDIDGNEYIDFINSQASVTLGYNDPDVTVAVKKQLNDAVILSLPHQLEAQVAEQIVDMVPCAEMVRFGKNGSDATAGAIRLARAFTKRDRVAVCGYHGWQDWYIGSTTRNLGVPAATRELTHVFKYNDLDSLYQLIKQRPDQFAAVIMEPMNTTEPEPGFLEGVKQLSKRAGALFIFDETITGFRYANGGGQEYFNVTPDLATFGKGLANGYPVSAVTGRADVMRLMEEVFFSFTFGGELLSLAAASAVLKKLKKKPVIKTLRVQGQKVLDGVKKIIVKHGLSDVLSVCGHPSWTFLQIKDRAPYSSAQIKTLAMQEFFARGILTYGTHNMSFAHSDKDVKTFLTAYNEVVELIGGAIRARNLERVLKCKPLEPLFKIR